MLGPRIWYSENHRLGFALCSPFANFLNRLSGFLFVLGWLLLLGTAGYVLINLFRGAGEWQHVLYPLGAVAVLLAAWAIEQLGWLMADRKGFEYDYESDTASWRVGDSRIRFPRRER